MTAIPAQLVLRFPRTPGFAATDLLPNAAQVEARTWLDGQTPWPLNRLALYGAPGSGKSHLAHAWAEANHGKIITQAPTGGWPTTPIVLDSIEDIPDEPALLYLLNAAAESGNPVLLVSRTPPGRLPVRLPDLASRLRATTAVRIGPTDDTFLALLLARLFSEEQLTVPAPVQTWLLTTLPRSPAAIRTAVTRLSAAAFEAGRPVTRPFAAKVLEFCDNHATETPTPSPPSQHEG